MKTKEKPLPFTSYQKFMIAILAILQFTIILDFMILAPLSDILMKSLSITTKQFGWVVAAYAISAGVSGLFAAGFADKFDRKKMLMFFYVGFVLGTLFCGLANTYYLLLTARIVTGIFGGVIGAISMAIVTDIFELKQRGRVMGFIQMAFAGSQVLGIPIGLKIATIWDWHMTFLLIVALSIIVGITIIIKMKPINEHLKLQSNKSPLMHLWHTIQNKSYRKAFISTAFLPVGGFMLMTFSSAFLVNNIGILQSELATIYLFTGFSSIIVMPLIGKISDKIDNFKLFTIGSIITIVMVTIYTNLTAMPLWGIIIINMIMFMGIMSRMIPASILTSAVPSQKDRGAFMSLNASLQQMAGGVAAILAGLIVHKTTETSPIEHFDALGYVASFVTLVCIYLIYRVSKMIKNKPIEKPVEMVTEPEILPV